MNPRDPDHAARAPEPDGTQADWATEESVAEPPLPPKAEAGQADAGAARPFEPTGPIAAMASRSPADAGAMRPSEATTRAAHPAPAAPAPPAAGGGSWLASAEGLVPRDRVAPSPATAPSPVDPAQDLDFSGTRVYPRPQLPADDWGWHPAEEPEDQPQLPSVAARTASPYGWVPYDPEPDARSVTPQAAVVMEDPYGRQTLLAGNRPASAGPAVAWDPRTDPAYSYDPFEDERRRGIPWRRLVVSFVLGILLVGVVAVGAIYAYEQSYADRILPNVRIGSTDVSGLTRDVAKQRLTDAYKGYGQGTVQVTLNGASTEIPYADFGRRADIDAMLDAAFAVGRDPSLVDRLLGEFKAVTKGITITPTVVLDAAKLQQRVQDIARSAESEPVSAAAVVTPTGFATTPSRPGQSVSEGSASADVAKQLASIDAPQTVQIALTATPLPPAVSDSSAQLASKQAALMDNDIVLTDGPDTWVVPAATVHTWLSFTIINNRVRIAIDTKAVLAELKPLAKKIDRTAVSATVKLQGTKIVFGKPSVEGRTFNPSKTTTAVVNGLRSRALGNLAVDAPIAANLERVTPALTTDQAKAAIPLMKQISSWSTNYQPSDRNGNGANIKIPTATISGSVVAPGETFSFWKAVGPVTRELGYTDGGAIIDGHTEPQGALAGGICSCSTTLFNAALRAGFPMGDRLNHFYYINRYPLGLDATVFISASGQAQDMTWTNDTQYPVVIQGVNATGVVKFVLYSVPNGRTVTFSDPIVKNYTKAHTETKVDKSLPRGTRKQIEYATDGQDVWVTRTVKDKSGAVIDKETFYSHYATITGIILTNP